MNKGIQMVCQHCLRPQNVTELVAHDVLGVPYREAQRFIGQYRELVDPKKQYAAKIKAYQDVGLLMLSLLKRIAENHEPCCKLIEEAKALVAEIESKT